MVDAFSVVHDCGGSASRERGNHNCVIATTTWNTVDLLEPFLAHYKKLGVQQVLVMDYDSDDGTHDVLTSTAWSDFVCLIPYPGLENLDSSNILLRLIKKLCPPDTRALFCDPDEFLVTPTMRIVEAVSSGSKGGCVIPRYNVTASLDTAQSDQASLHPLGKLVYRIGRPVKRQPLVDLEKEMLDPPWIYTALPGKVLVNATSTTSIGDGDHGALYDSRHVRQLGDDAANDGVYLLHYPFRTWAEFEHKIEMAKIDFGLNPHAPPSYGWQIRRWMRLSAENKLYSEYLSQFVPAHDLDRMLAEGVLQHDDSVVLFNVGTPTDAVLTAGSGG